MIDAWETGQFSSDFRLDDCYDLLENNGALLALYGSPTQRGKGNCDAPYVFDVLALHATSFCLSSCNDPTDPNDGTRWTPLLADFEAAAYPYYNDSVNPHPSGCEVTCPQ